MSAFADPSRDPSLAALYQEIILDHYRRPRNKRALDAADAEAEVKNPVCGDEVTVAITVEGDRVADAAFTGRGCSISQSSASMLTTLLRGRTLAEADALIALVRAMLHGDAEAASDPALGDLRALAGVARFPARIRCAALPWEALVKAKEELGR